MERGKLSENDAYATLRKRAMDAGVRLADIARRVLEAADSSR
jgi:response regulator NasT